MAVFKKNRKEAFLSAINEYIDICNKAVSTDKGDWIVKGFIDVAQNIYTISADTKVISKIMELLLLPHFCEFATKNGYELVLAEHQNHYPDLTFIDADGFKYAVDIKSTYSKGNNKVNGMTLGAFTGYFRERSSLKNIRFPYSEYTGHFVFGLIYSRAT